MIQVKHLRKDYWVRDGRVAAVCGIDFEVAEGEIFMLLGASGCGKTTTLRCVAGLEIPDDGEISLGGQVVFGDRGDTLVPVYQRGVGMVFQSYAIWPHLTVFENVAYPLLYGLFKIHQSEVKPRVRKVLSLVGLSGFEDRPAPLLSGGQQQRIALARALAYEPKVLLLDEPLSNLDAKLRAEMRVELRRLIKDLFDQRSKGYIPLCHPRSGRSPCFGRSHCRDGRWEDHSDRHSARSLQQAGQ